jgi:hypothetical protein
MKEIKIVWTEVSEAAFFDTKKAIHECPRLFFSNNVSLIYMETDASDYGVGAFLYQIVDAYRIY